MQNMEIPNALQSTTCFGSSNVREYFCISIETRPLSVLSFRKHCERKKEYHLFTVQSLKCKFSFSWSTIVHSSCHSELLSNSRSTVYSLLSYKVFSNSILPCPRLFDLYIILLKQHLERMNDWLVRAESRLQLDDDVEPTYEGVQTQVTNHQV